MAKSWQVTLLIIATMALAVVAPTYADEWGSWDDLPDDLLSSESTRFDIDDLYDQLSSNDELPDDIALEIDNWLLRMDLDFEDNEELAELLENLADADPDEISDEVESWLADQLDEYESELDNEEDELDEPDEEDEEDELDEFEEEEVDS